MLDAGKILVNSLMRRVTFSLIAALIVVVPLRAAAHDIPTDVRVSAFVKPDGQRLNLLIRVPLKAMREVDYPRRGAGLLDLARAIDLTGDRGLVRLGPRWHQAAWRFVESGFLHILEGTDHLLFLLCLVIPFRRLGQLALIGTSFTVAHSITLIASAYDLGPD